MKVSSRLPHPDLQAAAHNLLAIRADMLKTTRDLAAQATLMADDVTAACLDDVVARFETYPPVLAFVQELIEKHRP